MEGLTGIMKGAETFLYGILLYVHCTLTFLRRPVVQGVSKKSDDFILHIFQVVLVTQQKIGYHIEACSKIFCFEWISTPWFILLGRTEDMFEAIPVSMDVQFCAAQRGLRCSGSRTVTGGTPPNSLHL